MQRGPSFFIYPARGLLAPLPSISYASGCHPQTTCLARRLQDLIETIYMLLCTAEQ